MKNENADYESESQEESFKNVIMNYPFEISSLPNNLENLFLVDNKKIEWSIIVEMLRKEINRDSLNVNLQFCYLYALYNEAKSIHVDDLKETTNFCLKQISNYSLDTQSRFNFKNELEQTIELIILKENEIEILNSLNLETLSFKDKKELAFRLNDKGGIENYKKAAIIYHDLYNSEHEQYNKFYNFGNEVICLLRSKQYLLAEGKFQTLINWDLESGASAYPYIIDYTYSEMLFYFEKNRDEFLRLWNAAKSHNAIKLNNYFPVSYPNQDLVLKIALDLELNQVLVDLITNYETNRPKDTKSDEILVLIEKAKNAIQQ